MSLNPEPQTLPAPSWPSGNPDVSVHDLHKLDALEAVLFAWHEPLPLDKIAGVLEVKPELAFELTRFLTERMRESGAVTLAETPDGFRLFTKPEFAEYIERLREPQRIRLSKPALETLAIIAYRQPLTRAEVDHIRGVDSSGTLLTLADRGLVEAVGRREAPGRPVIYATTSEFLEHFGMRDLTELPELPADQIAEQARDLFDRETRLMAQLSGETPNATATESYHDDNAESEARATISSVAVADPGGDAAGGGGPQDRADEVIL